MYAVDNLAPAFSSGMVIITPERVNLDVVRGHHVFSCHDEMTEYITPSAPVLAELEGLHGNCLAGVPVGQGRRRLLVPAL
jgi:hypothetical protein